MNLPAQKKRGRQPATDAPRRPWPALTAAAGRDKLTAMKYLREGCRGDTDPAFDLSSTEKATLRVRYEQLRANPSTRTYTIEEIASDLGVRLRDERTRSRRGTSTS